MSKPLVSYKHHIEQPAWRCCTHSASEIIHQQDVTIGGKCGALSKILVAAVAVPLYVCLRVSVPFFFSS